jgi:hypothetical protein
MTEFETAVMQELSEIKSVSAATAQQVVSLESRLFNGGSGVVQTIQSDIQEIKADRKTDEKWERLHNVLHYSLTPLVVTIHSIARHFGVNI